MQVFILLFSALKKCSCLAGEPEVTEEDSEQHEQESVNSNTSDTCSSPESTPVEASLTSVEESVTSDNDSTGSVIRELTRVLTEVDDDSIGIVGSVLGTLTRVPREADHIVPVAESAPEVPFR